MRDVSYGEIGFRVTLRQVDAEGIAAIVRRALDIRDPPASISIDLWIIVIGPRDFGGQCRFIRLRVVVTVIFRFAERSRIIGRPLARG